MRGGRLYRLDVSQARKTKEAGNVLPQVRVL